VSTASDVAGATQQAAGDTASAAKEQAVQVGSTAASAATDVVGTAKEQVGAVAGEAASQAKDLLQQTRDQVGQQAGAATQKLGSSVQSLADELRSMGEGSGDGSGPAAELARTVAAKGDAIADFLSSKGPGELLADIRSYASRNPGTFLLGALAAGALAGRFVKGASADAGASPSGPSTAATAAPPAVPTPPLGIAAEEPIVLPTADPLLRYGEQPIPSTPQHPYAGVPASSGDGSRL
jgi:hypothetical protein